MKNNTIVIVGLGLMGASLGLALRKAFPKRRIIGLIRDQKKIARAVKQRIITEGTTDVAVAFHDASVVVIATPIAQIPYYIASAEQYCPAGTIVTDVGSAKSLLVRWSNKQQFKRIAYVGSHPLAGSHKSGLENAQPGLYDNALCFVTAARTSRAGIEIVRLWKSIGCRVERMSAERHDALLAASSHLPHLAAFALMHGVARANRKSLAYVGAGFKDTTRLAQSAANVWHDIFLSNRKNMVRETRVFIRELQVLCRILEQADSKALMAYLKKAAKERLALNGE